VTNLARKNRGGEMARHHLERFETILEVCERRGTTFERGTGVRAKLHGVFQEKKDHRGEEKSRERGKKGGRTLAGKSEVEVSLLTTKSHCDA